VARGTAGAGLVHRRLSIVRESSIFFSAILLSPKNIPLFTLSAIEQTTRSPAMKKLGL
jgi:hypothetical protein